MREKKADKMTKKELIHKARMQKARVHIGRNGITPRVTACFVQAFKGICTHPDPSDVVKVKVHPGYTGSIEDLITTLCRSNGARFLKQTGCFLLFHMPSEI